ncbi:hypothetical protein C0Q70_21187 [Pomacea canaliculata]|uniref:Uncharacterized protein n=1 Tax=Pomacea canaliculata TaxID=400727 RepID=A0A2T7NBU9_POMCA|nr:hypothetical protein C0Q70_21187 [Pomacea canaliculata]
MHSQVKVDNVTAHLRRTCTAADLRSRVTDTPDHDTGCEPVQRVEGVGEEVEEESMAMLSSPEVEEPRTSGDNPLFVHRKIEDDIQHFVENFKQKSSILDRRLSSDSGDSSGWTSSVFSTTDTPSTDSPGQGRRVAARAGGGLTEASRHHC